jgi:ribA/ribD-fused uncharacterized protein
MAINQFQGKYRFLSNFADSPFDYRGLKYPTVEHAFQAFKTLDISEQDKIRSARNPSEAKRMGRQIKMRSDWETFKYPLMEELVREKFKQNNELRMQLLDTGDEELIEGNWWGDVCWGVCNGEGENNLGKILMKVRAEFKEDLTF